MMMPDGKYWWSYSGIDIRWSFPITIIGIIVSCVLVDRFVGSKAASFLFLGWIVFITIASMMLSGISTPFQKNRQAAAVFGGPYCILLFAAWNPLKIIWPGPFYLLIYEDGIEIRTFFTAFFVPYQEMTGPRITFAHMWSGFGIECRLPDVPVRIDLHFVNRTKSYTAIQERLRHIRSQVT